MVTVEGGAKQVPLEKNKLLVETFLKKEFKDKKQVYSSDVADALDLDYETVREVFVALEKEGKIQESR